MIDMYDKGIAKHDWWQDWRGECVVIVASGMSAKVAGVEKLRDRIHVIVINENYQLCPWADILYSCDADWWVLRYKETKKFKGIKLSIDDVEIQRNKLEGMKISKLKIAKQHNNWVNEFLFDKPGVIGSGGNGGFQMINQTAQFGATGIGLVGFDMCLSGGIHWHGKHPSPLRNPDEARIWQWRKDLDEKSHKLKSLGIDIVNCSSVSALTSFPKMTIDQMLERWSL